VRRKDALFGLLTVATLALALPPLIALLRSTRSLEYYSHIPLIAAVSAYLIFRRRRDVFLGKESFHPLGIVAIAVGLGLGLAAILLVPEPANRATLVVFSSLVFWWGAYLILYGKPASRRALFPLAFLLFAVPVPVQVLKGVIGALVLGSTFLTSLLFTGLGVPFVQEGPIFHLPDFSIEVAQQCSGIRSSLALLVTTVLAGHLFLKKPWKQALLALAVFPVSLIKNAVRIVTLYLLSFFVDIRIIEGGFLHKSGGFLFFGLGLLILGFLLWLLTDKEGAGLSRQ